MENKKKHGEKVSQVGTPKTIHICIVYIPHTLGPFPPTVFFLLLDFWLLDFYAPTTTVDKGAWMHFLHFIAE
jgi:hypothetical protein